MNSSKKVDISVIVPVYNEAGNIIATISSKVAQLADVVSSVLVLETNQFRAVNTEKELTVSDVLTQAAQMKADDMAAKGYFSHVGPLGEEPWSWFDKVGYKYDYAGENLAVDYTESAAVTQGWINSATHRANLLNQNFTEIGIGIARGMYEGRQTTFVVQFFGTPVKKVSETVAVTGAKPFVVKPIINAVSSLATTSLVSVNPAVAVATVLNLPRGEVLGAEASPAVVQTNPSNIVVKMFILIGIILALICIISIMTVKFRNKKANTSRVD